MVCIESSWGDPSFLVTPFTDLKRVIYEVLCHVIRGDLKHEDVLPLLSDVTVGKLLAILISKLIIIILVPQGLRHTFLGN